MGWGQGLCFLVAFAMLSACPSGNDTQQSLAPPGPSTASVPPASGSNVSISGKPPLTARQDLRYSFQPTASGNSLSFSLNNAPPWLNVDSKSGLISGIVSDGDGHVYSNVTLSVSDGTSTATLAPFAITTSGDPLRAQQWHLDNTGQNSFSNSAGTPGADIHGHEAFAGGYTGQGVLVATSDTGLEIAHEDLKDNVAAGVSRDYTVTPFGKDPTNKTATTGDHGTAVAGIIGARGWNGVGGRGVAPFASLACFNFLSSSQSDAITLDQAAEATGSKPDIINQSWGTDSNDDYPVDPDYDAILKTGVTSGRHALGILYVKAAGNEFASNRNANADTYSVTPWTTVVGALNASGLKASYSNAGSNLWISAPGGEDGKDQPAIVTTDQSGCSKGYARTGQTQNTFQGGAAPNTSCNYTSTFNGTSSATPMLSGVMALMLEANPKLSWRDVRYILASTATKIDADFPDQTVDLSKVSYTIEQGWITNAAGFHFHNWYGFGRVNADDAVSVAKSYTAVLGPMSDVSVDSGAISRAIPDDNASGVSDTLSFPNDLVIESVQITVWATHTYTGDLGIELKSPAGTKSILFNARNSFAGSHDFDTFSLLSNAFFGEHSGGAWQIKIVDADANDTGTLTRWKIRIVGHP